MDLSALLETYRTPLVGLIVSWGAPWAEATELAQDSFAEAWLKRSGCRGNWQDPVAFGAWLRGVARNVYRNWRRSNQRREVRVVLSEAAVRGASSAPREQDARLADVRSAIDQLPRKQRVVVLMHYMGETKVADVAALLGVAPKTVEGRLYAARRSLRASLGVVAGGARPRTQLGGLLLWL